MGYEKLKYDIEPIQEGNKNDFTFDVDTNFPIEDVSDITFQVKNSLGEVVFSKKKSSGGITLAERTISVQFEPSDSKNKSGVHVYELDFKDLQGNPFATIGGKFTITKEVNTL